MPKDHFATSTREGDQAPRLTIQDVAEARNVSTTTVRRWIREGRLPAVRLGPQIIRVRPCDLAQLEEPVQSIGAYL